MGMEKEPGPEAVSSVKGSKQSVVLKAASSGNGEKAKA